MRTMAYGRSSPYDPFMARLTLSVDAAVVERAKAYAARQGMPPITRHLAGILKGSRIGCHDYRR